MSDLENERRKKAEDWADAVDDLAHKKKVLDSARREVEIAHGKVNDLETEVKEFVGRNVPRKLYKTEMGHVLVACRWKGSAEDGKYETDVELLSLS